MLAILEGLRNFGGGGVLPPPNPLGTPLVARMGERRTVCRCLVGKPEGKSPLGRPRCRWKDNIKIEIQDVG